MSDATRPVKPSNEWTVGDLRRILDACPDDAVLFMQRFDGEGHGTTVLVDAVDIEHRPSGIANIIFVSAAECP